MVGLGPVAHFTARTGLRFTQGKCMQTCLKSSFISEIILHVNVLKKKGPKRGLSVIYTQVDHRQVHISPPVSLTQSFAESLNHYFDT